MRMKRLAMTKCAGVSHKKVGWRNVLVIDERTMILGSEKVMETSLLETYYIRIIERLCKIYGDLYHFDSSKIPFKFRVRLKPTVVHLYIIGPSCKVSYSWLLSIVRYSDQFSQEIE